MYRITIAIGTSRYDERILAKTIKADDIIDAATRAKKIADRMGGVVASITESTVVR